MTTDPNPTGPPATAPATPAGRALLVVNARARRVQWLEAHLLAALRRHGLDLARAVRVRRPRRIGRTIDRLLDETPGVDRLIVGGGDGTLSAAAPIAARRGLALGVLPLGTANDFARTLAIPTDLDDAAEVAAGDSIRAVDLARANDAYFLNVASIGMSVAMTRELSPLLKRWLGPAAYGLAGARAFLRHPTFFARLIAPDGEAVAEARVHQVVVANGRFYGGGVLVAYGSRLDNGLLTSYSLGTRSRWDLLRTVALLKFQVPLDRPGDSFAQARRLLVETRPRRPVNLDGEIRTTTPVEFSIVPGALRVLAPPAPA